MDRSAYLNFDLEIIRTRPTCQARVLYSPVGETSRSFDPAPLDQASLEEGFMSRDEARAHGTLLFNLIFEGELLTLWRRAQDQARRAAQGLRLRIRVEDAQAARWGWETLFDAGEREFVALSRRITLARYVPVPAEAIPLPTAPPVRLLFASASPSDAPPLDVEREWRQVAAALVGRDRIRAEPLPHTTPERLRAELARDPYSIVHFAGHGVRLEDGAPALVLEQADGSRTLFDGEEVAILLGGYEPLRLLVLNACWGGAPSGEALAGLAQALIRRGLGAVVAMQVPVLDEMAAHFATTFYERLGKGESVEAAVAEGRRALALADDSAAWCSPVLFLRAGDSRLFTDEREEPVTGRATGRGDTIVTTITLGEGAHATDITVGKNIVKIGRLVLPFWAIAAAFLLPLLLGIGSYLAFVPARMSNEAGQFNVAVARFGEQGGDTMRRTATADLLGQWLATGLEEEQPGFVQSFGSPLQIWHDGMPPLAKRRTLGLVVGSDGMERQDAAEVLAREVNANVIIYGVVGPQPGGDGMALAIEFYVRPDPTLKEAIETRVGHFRFGDPIPLPDGFDPSQTGSGEADVLHELIVDRGRALAWLVRALDRERRGNREEMIAVLEQAADESGQAATGRNRWPERGAGKEILYTLLGEAQLELAYRDTSCASGAAGAEQAEAAFQQALASQPTYFFAVLGLGNVATRAAQCLLTVNPREVQAAQVTEALAHLDRALAQFQRAEQGAPFAPDPPYALNLAHLASASAYRLKALALLHPLQSDLAPPDAAAAASGALEAGLQALSVPNMEAIPEKNYRLRARAWLMRGNLSVLEAGIGALAGDGGSCTVALQGAVRAFDACEAEASNVFQDVYLQETLVPLFCTPQKRRTLCLLGTGPCQEGETVLCPPG